MRLRADPHRSQITPRTLFSFVTTRSELSSNKVVFGSTVHLLSLLCCAMRFHLIIVLASTASTAALTRTQMEYITGVRLPGPPEVSTDDVANLLLGDPGDDVANLLLGDPTESKDTPPHTPESQSPTSVAGAIRELQRIAQTAVRNSLSMTTHKVSRFDVFTRIIALQNKIEVDDWRARNAPLGRPTARDVDVPVAKRDVDHVQCGLAYNAEADAVVVAKTDEHQARASLIPTLGVTVSHRDLGLPPRPRWSLLQEVEAHHYALLSIGIGETLGYPLSADVCGEWRDDEDASSIIKEHLFGAWPEHRVLVPWGADRMSDRALEDLVFFGMGQHRVQRACTHAAGGVRLPACAARGEDAYAPDDAYYAVYMDFAEGLEVRQGFAALGASAYFDKNGTVVAIRRLGVTYTPDGPQGRRYRPSSCTWAWGWQRACRHWWCPSLYWPTKTCSEEEAAVYGWRNAKCGPQTAEAGGAGGPD